MNKIQKLFNKLNDMEKVAYPNFSYRDPLQTFDVNKWVMSMQKVHSMQQKGMDKFSAVSNVTKGWSVNEVDNFINWMKYYESGDFLKYKYASLYSTSPGYYLHMNKSNNEFKPDFSKADDSEPEEQEEDDKPQRLAAFKKKMISRLNSLEKLLSSSDGQEFLAKDSDELINVIFDLKKRFTKLKVASFYSFHDEIIRVAKTAKSNPLVSEFLMSLAQASAPPPAQQTQLNENTGNPGGIPSQGPGAIPPGNAPVIPTPPPMPDVPPSTEESVDKDKSKGASEFVNKFTGDSNNSDDIHEEDYLFVSEAQEVPVQNKPRNEPTLNPANTNPDTQPAVKSDYDNRIDDLFKNVRVEDVISKLDALSNIFKEREIPRQLGIIDMMLNALNLSQMFPGLSESHNKALESNNYILTRIEDISSKLRGSIKGPPIDLTPRENPAADPQASAIKQNLEQEQEKEKRRKDLRKQVENEALDKIKETPEIEVSDKPTPVVEAPQTPAPVKV